MTDTPQTQITLSLDDRDEAVMLFGTRDQHLRLIKEALSVRLIARGDTLQIDGPEDKVDQAQRAFTQLRELVSNQGKLGVEDVRNVLAIVMGNSGTNLTVVEGGRHVRPRTDGQARYVQTLAQQRPDPVHRPSRHRQNLSRRRHGGDNAPPITGQTYRARPSSR